MPLNVPVFLTRLGSSVVFVAVMLTGLLWNEWSFLALVCLINYLCLREYFRLMRAIHKNTVWPAWLGAVIQFIGFAAILYLASLWSLQGLTGAADKDRHIFYYYVVIYTHVTWLIFIIPVLPLALLAAGWLSKERYYKSVLRGLLGLIYISMPMLFLFCMYKTGAYIPLMLICMIWSNDTMAYLVGSFIGKTPLSSISPKKTREGTIGGAVITIAAAAAVGYFTHSYTMTDWMAIALCATVAGTFGDLLESKLKRMADVKDSGHMMPGHGGALDRFDSLLVATPFAFAYVMYFMK